LLAQLLGARKTEGVGLTTLKVRLSNPRNRRLAVEEDLLVDSGAIYAVVPAPVLRRIGLRPRGEETFTLVDGTHVTREVGTVFFEIDDREGASKVIFGRRGDARLIGAVALEELGLMLDPLKRRLRPLRLMLA
jgi:predicted aspartyl protease